MGLAESKNEKLDYFDLLPDDIQKSITKYFLDTESINKIIKAYPKYKERICNSLEVLEYKDVLNKNKDKNKILLKYY